MPSAEFDLGYLEAASELLQKYLLSKEIYWKIHASSPPGEPGYPSLTLGAILLSQKRLAARELTAVQENRKLKLDNQLEHLRTKWRTAWGDKAGEEFRSRLDLWRNYLEEFRKNPQGNVDRFPYEVGRRVMLQLLEPEANDIPTAQQQMLVGLDRILEGLMVKGGFVWEDSLAAGFFPDDYPYLYYNLRN